MTPRAGQSLGGRPVTETVTPVNVGNQPHCDNGEGVATASPLPSRLKLPLDVADDCRSVSLAERFMPVTLTKIRLTLDQSGDQRGPQRGSRAGVLVSPHSKRVELKSVTASAFAQMLLAH